MKVIKYIGVWLNFIRNKLSFTDGFNLDEELPSHRRLDKKKLSTFVNFTLLFNL